MIISLSQISVRGFTYWHQPIGHTYKYLMRCLAPGVPVQLCYTALTLMEVWKQKLALVHGPRFSLSMTLLAMMGDQICSWQHVNRLSAHQGASFFVLSCTGCGSRRGTLKAEENSDPFS